MLNVCIFKGSIFLSYFISLVAYMPAAWQYENWNITTGSENNTWLNNPWMYVPKYEDEWISYACINLIVMKIIPMVSVLIMNIIMIMRLRKRFMIKRKYQKSMAACKGDKNQIEIL